MGNIHMLKSRSQDRYITQRLQQYSDAEYSVLETVLGRLYLDSECGFGELIFASLGLPVAHMAGAPAFPPHFCLHLMPVSPCIDEPPAASRPLRPTVSWLDCGPPVFLLAPLPPSAAGATTGRQPSSPLVEFNFF